VAALRTVSRAVPLQALTFTMKQTVEASLLVMLLGIGCSGSGDGDVAGGDGASGSGGGTAQGGAPAGGGRAATSCEADAFSGPQLRDCDLPGFCGRCLWEKACDQFLFQCAHDADCVCMAECVGEMGVGGTDSCLGQCGLAAAPPGFSQFVKLAADMCWDEGCGRLDAPPPDSTGSTSAGSLGAGTDADCAFDPGLAYDPCGPVLQLQSADGSICVRIERRDDGAGTDANTAWTLLDVRVGPLGQVCHADDPSNLCWFSSHHNYADWVHVSCGNRHYDVDIGNNCGQKNPSPTPAVRLLVFESAPPGDSCAPTVDGTCPLGAPIDLIPAPY
jgi:hypothetical protein